MYSTRPCCLVQAITRQPQINKQSRSFESWIFGFAADIDAMLDLLHDLLLLELRSCIHFSSPLTIRCENPFFFGRWSSFSLVTRYRSMTLGFNTYGTQCPCFWIIPNAFKRFKMVVLSTLNDSISSACIWQESSRRTASNSSSLNFFGAPGCSLFSTSKSLFLKRLNESLHVVSNRAWSQLVSTRSLYASAADFFWIK